MKSYIRLARPHHWIKNLLVLLPLLCSGQLPEGLTGGLLAFFAFSFAASAIYCVNDIHDRERDRQSPTKHTRPLASGALSVSSARWFSSLLLLLSLSCQFLATGLRPVPWILLSAYLLLNLGYSMGLKNIPLLDIAILVSGFVLRMLYGGQITGHTPSKWLCLTVMAISFYLGLGKRRGELADGSTRQVLQYYSNTFLSQNMYMCLGLAVVFYALWTVDNLTVARVGSESLIWTVPLLILICLKYSLAVENGSEGDPVEVLLGDRVLILLGLIFGIMVFGIIYL